MASALLETKLYVPRPRRGSVPRPRLRGRLHLGLEAKLVLVSAPAGFGKTTLLADWLAAVSAVRDGKVVPAWLSLDAADNEPNTFWSYVVAALRTAAPDVGENAGELLLAAQPPTARHLLTTLLNDLTSSSVDIVLVLDDYHVVDSTEVHDGMQFLLDHLPPNLRMVIASRADPALALPRLRARGDLVELRAVDLRFTDDEAASYLNETMGLSLGPEDVAALEARTEGWIAALQLAALSMAGRDDLSAFIAGFAGDDRYVVDYLVEEVLARQPTDVQSFLLETSVLDRMNGPLCDALTGGTGSRAVLEALERGNLFLVPLDDRRQWYRYHHLFADVLRARLLDEQPQRIAALHRRASAWFERDGDRIEAVRHALAGQDAVGAAALMEQELPTLRRDRRESVLRAWLEQLPDDVLRTRPVLANALAGALMSTGTFDGVEELLAASERWLNATDGSPPMVVTNHDEFRRLPAEIAYHRSGLALLRGDVDATLRHARQALQLAVDDDHLTRGAASALIGLAGWWSGDLDTAETSYAACLADFERIGYISDVLGCSITLADIQVTRGRLRAALTTYEQGLALAVRRGDRLVRGTVDMHVGRAAVLTELGDLTAARRELARSREIGEHAGLPKHACRWRIVSARLCEAEGDLDAALRLLDEAEQLYDGDFSPDVRPVTALRARTWCRQGRVDEALRWAERRGLTATDEVSYLRELEHLTLARALVARHAHRGDRPSLDQAIDLLARLLGAARDGGRFGSVVEILVVAALAHQQRGDLDSALDSLTEALTLAEPEGHVRVFADEGAPVAALLATAENGGRGSPYARRLRAELGAAVAPAHRVPDGGTAGLVDPLSSREREVLRLLATELNGPEIARELVVSLNTVRTHTKNLYLKLGVNSRRAAVRKAQELELL